MDRERTPVLRMLREGEPRSRARSRQQFAATAFPPALLAALRFPPVCPVLSHAHRHRSSRSCRHRAATAPPASYHLAIRRLRLTSATKQLRKFTSDRRLLLAKLFEPRDCAQPCELA